MKEDLKQVQSISWILPFFQNQVAVGVLMFLNCKMSPTFN